MNSLAFDPTGPTGLAGRYYTMDSPNQSNGTEATSATLYQVSASNGAITPAVTVSFGLKAASVRGLAFSPQGDLYAVNNLGSRAPFDNPNDLYKINLQTGQATLIGSTGVAGIQALAFSPDGALYGYSFNAIGLFRINPNTAGVLDVNPTRNGNALPNTIQSLSFAPDGTLYANDLGPTPGRNGRLFTIDPTTGIETVVASGTVTDLRGIEFIPEPTGLGVLTVGCLTLGLSRRPPRPRVPAAIA